METEQERHLATPQTGLLSPGSSRRRRWLAAVAVLGWIGASGYALASGGTPQPPTVGWIAPVPGASYTAGDAVTLIAAASDSDGIVTGVTFAIDGATVATGVDGGNGTFSAIWIPSVSGSFSATATASDNAGLSATSTGLPLAAQTAPPAAPRCTTTPEVNQFKTSVKQYIGCNQNKLVLGPTTSCTLTPPPACAGSAVAAAMALAHGVNNPPAAKVDVTIGALKKQNDCQAEIAKAVYNYMGDKTTYLTQGLTPAQAEAQASTWFSTVPSKCTAVQVKQDVSGVVLPKVGAPCDTLTGAVGSTIDEVALTACVHAAADAILTPMVNYLSPVVSLQAPSDGSSFQGPVDLTLSASASDPDGTISQVTFVGDNGVTLGVGTATSGVYSFFWPSVPPGAHAVTAVATDAEGLVKKTAPTVFSVLAPPSLIAPVASIISPASGATFGATASIPVDVAVSDSDGYVVSVDYYADTAYLGAGLDMGDGTFNYVWSAQTSGSYQLFAVATDDDGQSTTTAPVTVHVTPQPLAVTITSPLPGTSTVTPSVLPVLVAVEGEEVNAVEVYADSVFLGLGAFQGNDVYAFDWAFPTPGAHTLYAVVFDLDGDSVQSLPVDITLTPSTISLPPTVALAGPAAGTSVVAGDPVILSATASDVGNGVVTAVSFSIDGTSVASATYTGNGLYSAVWVPTVSGSYSLTATALDDDGMSATSAASTIVVSPTPTTPPRCTTSLEANQFKTSVKQYIGCNQNKLGYGPATSCTLTPPPSCSGTVVADATALAHGANNPPAAKVDTTLAGLRKQYDCQGEMAKAIYSYMGDKAVYLTQGQTPAQAEAQAATWFSTVPAKCTGVVVKTDVSGVVLPTVGPQCSAYVGAPGATINEPALTSCLHATADGLLKTIGNYLSPSVSLTSPSSGASFSSPANLLLSASASDSDGTVAQVSFLVDGQLLGVGTATGGSYALPWNAVPAGAHAIQAIASDNDGLTAKSSVVVVGVLAPPPNAAPDIVITSPANGATALAPAAVDLVASASDYDGTITSVTFLANNVVVGAGTDIGGGSYGLTWTALVGGTFSITAVAVDDLGTTTVSAPVSVDIQTPPSVQLSSPVAGGVYLSSAPLIVAATASDADGSIVDVSFFLDGTWAASATSTGSAFTATLTGISGGSHDLYAVATDDDGRTSTAGPVTFTVSEPPSVVLTSPTAAASFTTAGAVSMVAVTTQGSATIAGVTMQIDGVPTGTAVHGGNGVYSQVWLSPTLGTHTISAVVTDSAGLSSTSAPITINVSSPATTLPTCTTAEATTLQKALTEASNCNYLRHVFGPGYACTATAAPACAPTTVGLVMGLAWGPNYPALAMVKTSGNGNVAPQLSCQAEIGKTTATYVYSVVQNIVAKGQTPTVAQSNAAASFNTLPNKCTGISVKQDATGVILPAVGPQCQSYVGGVGSIVDVPGLTACLNQTAAPWTKPLAYLPPAVKFGSPAQDQLFPWPAHVPMVIHATDSDGSIVSVTVSANGEPIGLATPTPGGIYTFDWAAPGGAHALTATALDDDGFSVTSAPLVVAETFAPSGVVPSVNVVSPTSNDVFESPASVTIDVMASDADGSIAQVDVYGNGGYIGAASSVGGSLYSIVWNNVRAGTHNVYAIARDNAGNEVMSDIARARVDNAFTTARCASNAEAQGLAQALESALDGDDGILTGGLSDVPLPPPPCSDSAVADIARLAYGVNDPPAGPVDLTVPAMQSAYGCQLAINESVGSYVQTKMGALVAGTDPVVAHQSAEPSLQGVLAQCDGVTVVQDAGGVVLPAVGAQCAAAVGSIGSSVDGQALEACLGSLLDIWTNRIGPSPQPLRPNILFILTDDQRRDTLGATHSLNGSDVMPNTRQLIANRGVEFSNAFLTTPICGPSRASILTGQYSNHHGVYRNASPYGAEEFVESSTLATWLESAGYQTGLFGKYINGYEDRWKNNKTPHLPPGWTVNKAMQQGGYYNYIMAEGAGAVFHGTSAAEYSTDVVREQARTFMTNAVQAGSPFFAWVGFYAPHAPFQAAPRHTGAFASVSPWRPPSFQEADVSDKPAWLQLFGAGTPAQIATNDADRVGALESLLAVDEAIGGSAQYGITGLLETLTTLGIERDTVVIYMTDNGYAWGEHRLTQKARVYEEQVRTPMFIRYPRLVPLGRVDAHIVANIDIAPTLAELAGVTPPDPVDGVSMVRVLDGTEHQWRSHVLIQGYNAPVGAEYAAVHEGVRKYVECAPGDKEYYDLTIDPNEMDSAHLNPANAATMADMASKLRVIRPRWPSDVP